MIRSVGFIVLLFGFMVSFIGCGAHLFDKSQVPIVNVSEGVSPTISWIPSNAYQVGIYKGDKIGNGSIGEIWNVGRNGGYTNKLNSPIEIDINLEYGETYTVYVQRKDPKGTGSGFSNTHKRYIGTKTFTVK